MKKCAIISGGVLEDDDFHRRLLADIKMVICADGGARYALRLGILPNLVLGDLDTLDEGEIQELRNRQVAFQEFPAQKDYTDTHLCLLKALKLGFREIIMVGCLGGRFDHALANVMLLALPQVRKVDVRIIDPYQEIFLVKSGEIITGRKGETLSLFPVTEETSGISTKGLVYHVPGGKFFVGEGNGVSNTFAADEAIITYTKGLLLGVHLKNAHRKKR